MDSFIAKKTKEVFGEEFELFSFERLLGGAQKHTYLAKCTNGFEFVIYQWDKSTTFLKIILRVLCFVPAVHIYFNAIMN